MDQTCGTSLAVQGLRLHGPNTGVPTQEALLGCLAGGTRIPPCYTVQPEGGLGAVVSCFVSCLTKRSQTLNSGPSTATVLPTRGTTVLFVMWDLAP